MGWIKELDDLMSKSKLMKFLIVTAFVVIIFAFGSVGFVVVKSIVDGRGVEAGNLKFHQNKGLIRNKIL